jgi:hypothetical protein
MQTKQQFDRCGIKKLRHDHLTFFQRPHWTRRQFFEVLGAGVTGSFLVKRAGAAVKETAQQVTPVNKAKNTIFILMTGAPSHTDMFDLKVLNGTTPGNFNPASVSGVEWPTGLLPNLAKQLPNFTLVRSMHAHALVHSLGQTWAQIGRNPAAALGDIAPNIGSVVALEKEADRQPNQVFPTFLQLNSPAGVGEGYFSAQFAPFKYAPIASGLPDTTNIDGQARVEERLGQLHAIDDALRINSPLGTPLSDMNDFYASARSLMYNSAVTSAFSYSKADSMRYGSSSFGNACLVAKQVLAANQGTRFVQISFGSWDMHVDIYGAQNPKGNNLYTMGTPFDNGLSTLMADLQSSGLLATTMIVAVGEFGRTVGPVTPAGGRDHWLQLSALFAGAGIKGGRAIGATDAQGSDTVDFGWSQQRYVYPEDIEATIYSAMGINWTTTRYDDPFGRGFEYVPQTDPVQYYPVNELWG